MPAVSEKRLMQIPLIPRRHKHRIHIQRLGRCAGVITPKTHTPNEAVAIMTGATTLEETPGRASA